MFVLFMSLQCDIVRAFIYLSTGINYNLSLGIVKLNSVEY